jgi:hypothetical protein
MLLVEISEAKCTHEHVHVLPRSMALGYYYSFFIIHGLVSCGIFLLSSAKLVREFCDNRRSMVNTFPHFAHSFVSSLILRQYC